MLAEKNRVLLNPLLDEIGPLSAFPPAATPASMATPTGAAAASSTVTVASAIHVLGWPGSPGWVELGAGSHAVEVHGVQ